MSTPGIHSTHGRFLVRAAVMQLLFEQNKSDFITKYPLLADPFSADFLALIDQALAYPTNRMVLGDQLLLRNERDKAQQAALSALREYYSYVRLAFEKDYARKRATGIRKMRSGVYSSVRKVLPQLALAHDVGSMPDFKPELFNKGYSQPQFDALETLMADLNAKHIAYLSFKMHKPIITAGRRKLTLSIRAFMQRINNCALEVYKYDAAKRKMFRLGVTP